MYFIGISYVSTLYVILMYNKQVILPHNSAIIETRLLVLPYLLTKNVNDA